MSWKTCVDCDRPFAEAESPLSRCLPCHKRRHGWEWTPSDRALAAAQARLRQLEQQLVGLEAEYEDYRSRNAGSVVELAQLLRAQQQENGRLRLQLAATLRRLAASRSDKRPPALFSSEQLRQLVRFCHPDRHSNTAPARGESPREQAEAISRWLLPLYQATRKEAL